MGLMSVIVGMRALVFINTLTTGTIAGLSIYDHKEHIKDLYYNKIKPAVVKVVNITESIKPTLSNVGKLIYTKLNNTKRIIYNRYHGIPVWCGGPEDDGSLSLLCVSVDDE